jgi:hypothetical protein
MPAWLHQLNEHFPIRGLEHPGEITAAHIVRRVGDHEVKLLANLLPFVRPGVLLAGQMPQRVFELYWPLAQSHSFAVTPMEVIGLAATETTSVASLKVVHAV